MSSGTFSRRQDHGTRGNSWYNYPDAWSDAARTARDTGHILVEFSELNVGMRPIAGPSYLARLSALLDTDSDPVTPLDPFNLTDTQLALLQEEAENVDSLGPCAYTTNEFGHSIVNSDLFRNWPAGVITEQDTEDLDDTDRASTASPTHLLSLADLGMEDPATCRRRPVNVDYDGTAEPTDLAWRGFSIWDKP